MSKQSKFSLDVGASADLGRDIYEGPEANRPGVSLSSFQRQDEEIAVLIDVNAYGALEIPLAAARQLKDALEALLAELGIC